MGTETKHTPTPWQVDERNGCIAIYEASVDHNCLDIPKQNFIAYFSGYRDDLDQWQVRDKDSANAAFIVQAVNSHADLIAALKAVRTEITRGGHPSRWVMAEIIDAALAKAKEVTHDAS